VKSFNGKTIARSTGYQWAADYRERKSPKGRRNGSLLEQSGCRLQVAPLCRQPTRSKGFIAVLWRESLGDCSARWRVGGYRPYSLARSGGRVL